MDFKELLLKLNMNLTESEEKMFLEYYSFLIDRNRYVNLTAIVEYEEVYIKHFYDSLILSNVIDLNHKSLIDVGSGAGFPSIPLAIMNENLDVTIIDALGKRIDFLNELIGRLGLKNAKAFHERAEEYQRTKREAFDIATARAVARLNMLVELCLPLVKVGGYFLAMKSQDADEELKEAKNAIHLLGGRVVDEKTFDLPYDMGQRKVIVIKKVKETPNKYPRAFAKIKNSPLK